MSKSARSASNEATAVPSFEAVSSPSFGYASRNAFATICGCTSITAGSVYAVRLFSCRMSFGDPKQTRLVFCACVRTANCDRVEYRLGRRRTNRIQEIRHDRVVLQAVAMEGRDAQL